METTKLITLIIIDSIIIFFILSGNILTILAIKLSKKLSELLSNRYILSLAISDIMVGLTIPYHLAFVVEDSLGSQKSTCLLRFVLIILACSSSIYNLLAIAADRYIAIVLPFYYNRHMCGRVVCCIIISGWLISITVATAPIYWNDWKNNRNCTMDEVLADDYINYILLPMFSSIWIAMFILYLRIWKEASEHTKRLQKVSNLQNKAKCKNLRDNKSVQMVLLILGVFSFCWLPYFATVISIRHFDFDQNNVIYEAAFSMAVMNSFMNPLIYAWKSKNYRKAFISMLKCRSPKNLQQDHHFITDHVPGKSRKREASFELQHISFQERCEDKENSDVTVTTCIGHC